MHGAETKRVSDASYQLSSLSGVTDSAKFSWQQSMTVCVEYCQAGKFTRALVSRVFTGAWPHRHG